MPLVMNDMDITPKLTGLRSVLIVPCNMCPAVSVAIREKKPFMQLGKGLFRSAPFHQYLQALQSRLQEKGIKAKVFKSRLYHNWFMCMWTAHQRNRLKRVARQFDAVIVLGCASATEIVLQLVKLIDCKVIEGMEVVGITNAQLRFKFPATISFADCKVIPLSQHQENDPCAT